MASTDPETTTNTTAENQDDPAHRDAPVPPASEGWLLGLLGLAAALIAFAPSIGGQFLWGDEQSVGASVMQGPARGLLDVWLRPGATMRYEPLASTSLWLGVHAHGLAPLGFRLVSLGLHLLTAVLLARAVRAVAPRAAALAGCVFAVHPLVVEPVAWITERGTVLAAPLVLGSFLGLAGAARALPDGRRERALGLAALGWGAFALAMFASSLAAPAAVVIPLLLVPMVAPAHRARLALLSAPLVGVAVAVGAVALRVERTLVAQHIAELGAPLGARLAHVGQALAFYATRVVWPFHLAFFYPSPSLGWPWPSGLWLLALAALVLAALAALAWRRHPWPLLVALSFVALVSPALGLIELDLFRFTPVQNHFTYLAMLPACGALAAALAWLLDRRPTARARLRGAAVVLFVLVLGARSEAATFASTEALFVASTLGYPEAWPAQRSLGLTALQQNRAAEAISRLRIVAQLRPRDPDVLTEYATALSRRGQHGDALPVFTQVTTLTPGSAIAWFNLAEERRAAGQQRGAVEAYRRTLVLAPGDRRTTGRLAELLAASNDPAVRQPDEAVRLAQLACEPPLPARARCLRQLEGVYRSLERYEDAARTHQEFLRAAAAEAGKPSADDPR